MIPVLTYIAHINIGEYKKHFNYPETTPLTRFGSFLYAKNKRDIPKIMSDDPKNDAWRSQKWCLTVPKIMPDDCQA